MAENPIVPPLRKPVSTFPTPSHVVSMYTELVNRDDPAYKANAPVKRGSIYSTMVGAKPEVISQFPLLYFLRERQFQGDDQKVWWDWINDEAAHDTYNSTDSYAFESISHPGFQREYTIRRDEYNDEPAIALGLPLNTLIAVRIVDGGGNYTSSRIVTGEIGVRNIGDLLRVMDVENKLLGGDKIEIKIGQEGMSIPPEILMKLKGIMGRFVDPHEMEAFREAMDAELFPAFEAYAQAYESQRPKELPESTDERRD